MGRWFRTFQKNMYNNTIIIYVVNVETSIIQCIGRDGKQIDEDMQNYINEARYRWTGDITS
jgi:hypothetical protein